MKTKFQQGFTLIELLVVMAIIAILALIILLALNPVEMARRSRDSRRLSDLGTLRRAIDLTLADGKSLPKTAGGGIEINASTDVTKIGGSMDISKYLSVAPQDPIFDSAGGSVQVTKGDCTAAETTKDAVKYNFRSEGNVYVLRAQLESVDNCKILSQDGNNDDYYEIGTDPGLDLP